MPLGANQYTKEGSQNWLPLRSQADAAKEFSVSPRRHSASPGVHGLPERLQTGIATIPILSGQRHIEARVGQLLGEARPGNPHRDEGSPNLSMHDEDGANFRLLARALDAKCVSAE
jgi:hypothetical protein